MNDLLTSEELLLEDPDEGDLFRAELEAEVQR